MRSRESQKIKFTEITLITCTQKLVLHHSIKVQFQGTRTIYYKVEESKISKIAKWVHSFLAHSPYESRTWLGFLFELYLALWVPALMCISKSSSSGSILWRHWRQEHQNLLAPFSQTYQDTHTGTALLPSLLQGKRRELGSHNLWELGGAKLTNPTVAAVAKLVYRDHCRQRPASLCKHKAENISHALPDLLLPLNSSVFPAHPTEQPWA